MPSTLEIPNEILDSVHRRRIGYFSTGACRTNCRQEVDEFVQRNLAGWHQSFGPGYPHVTRGYDRWELEWHRPKTAQELAQERRDADARQYEAIQWERMNAYAAQQSQALAHHQAYIARSMAQVAAYAPLYGSALQAGERPAEPSPGVRVRVPRRQVGTVSLWTRLKVFFIALLTGASPFRVYWEIRHNALRVQDHNG